MRTLPILPTLLLTAIGSTAALGQTATTVQLPTFGVSISADGIVQVQTIADPTGALRAQRVQASQQNLPRDVQARSPLRKVSLVRLEQALQRRREAGQAPDETMRHLAGLQNVRFAFLYPDSHDIVLAGEAEAWVDDGLGRSIGVSTGRPIVRLDDLATALRAFATGDSTKSNFIGCTIDPTTEGLSRMQTLRAEMPRSIPDAARQTFAAELDRRTRESLGRATVRVFGIAPETHAAAVLVEADYRMKRIAIGIEPSPVPLANYVERATGAGGGLVRYWFVPDYQRLQTDAARQSLEVLGRGVRLQTEQWTIAADGSIQAPPTGATTAKVDPAAQGFCDDFTKRYDDIAARSPVFAELRTVVDLLVTAAFMRRHDWFAQAGWTPTLLIDPQVAPTGHAPKSAEAAVNTVWKGRRLISAAGGGVSIQVDAALHSERLREVAAEKFVEPRKSASQLPADDRWWWD